MKKLFKINGSISDPIVSNTIICVGTYIIVSIYTIAILIREINLLTEEAMTSANICEMIVKSFADSIIPSTITLILGIVVQNMILVMEEQIENCSYTFLLLFFCFVYAGIYVFLYDISLIGAAVLTIVGTTLIVCYAMCSICQIQETRKTDNKVKFKVQCNSISG